jgi:hypothetical protein
MSNRKSMKDLDGRDEFLIALIAAFIPVVTLGTLFF